MKNVAKLKKYIVLSDFTQGQLAKKLGTTVQSLNLKLNGKRELKANELEQLITLLGIPPAEAGELLFS